MLMGASYYLLVVKLSRRNRFLILRLLLKTLNDTAVSIADQQRFLQAILSYLEHQKAQGMLNNNGIPSMVRGCFYEMACVIAECARVLQPNAPHDWLSSHRTC